MAAGPSPRELATERLTVLVPATQRRSPCVKRCWPSVRVWPINLQPDPDGRFALHLALQEESTARTEYLRVLKIFMKLIPDGTPPGEEPVSDSFSLTPFWPLPMGIVHDSYYDQRSEALLGTCGDLSSKRRNQEFHLRKRQAPHDTNRNNSASSPSVVDGDFSGDRRLPNPELTQLGGRISTDKKKAWCVPPKNWSTTPNCCDCLGVGNL